MFTLEITLSEFRTFGHTKFGIIKLEIAFSSAQAPEFFSLGAHSPGLISTLKLALDHILTKVFEYTYFEF